MTKRKTLTYLMALLAALLAGCSSTVTWKEEVKLSDGQVIVVERETLRTLGGAELAHGGSGSRPKERRIRFEFPLASGHQVEWRSTKSNAHEWPEIPLVLDIWNDVPVVMTLNSGAGCLYYSMYAFRNSAWIEEPLADQFELRRTNLLLKSGPHMPDFVDLSIKDRENNSPRYDKTLRKVGPERAICNTGTSVAK